MDGQKFSIEDISSLLNSAFGLRIDDIVNRMLVFEREFKNLAKEVSESREFFRVDRNNLLHEINDCKARTEQLEKKIKEITEHVEKIVPTCKADEPARILAIVQKEFPVLGVKKKQGLENLVKVLIISGVIGVAGFNLWSAIKNDSSTKERIQETEKVFQNRCDKMDEQLQLLLNRK